MIRRLQDSGDLVRAFPRVHFVGIGGTGMSGIAEVMLTLGYEVSGSDNADNAATRRLAKLGARVMRGHSAANVLGTDCVVVSSAIREDNPELMEARSQRIPIMPRAAMLAELMRFRRGIAVAGTHGKTTTTSLAAAVLSEGGLDPTFVIGGQLLAAGANAKLGGGQWLVAEADESDGSFLRLNPLMAVITNIDADHLENYGNDFARVQAAFAEFLQRLPFYGLALLCIDDPEVAALAGKTPRHVMSYGMSENADVRAEDVVQDGPRMRFTLRLPEGTTTPVTLALPGRHNVLNALAAAAIGWQLGVAPDTIARAGKLCRYRPSLQRSGRSHHRQRSARARGRRLRPPPARARSSLRRGPWRLAGQAPGGGLPAAPLQPYPRSVRRVRRSPQHRRCPGIERGLPGRRSTDSRRRFPRPGTCHPCTWP